MNTTVYQENKIDIQPNKHFSYLVKDNSLFILVALMIFSYFYNLPVIGYSIKGDNELRLYDILGIFVVQIFWKNFSFYYYIIKKISAFKWLFYFILWCNLTILVTFMFSIFKENFNAFLQSVLYLYHLWIFFITSIIFYVISFNKSKLKIFVHLIVIFSILSCLVIVLQNFGLIPFLWGDNYYRGYQGFLSGTLGPNKVVSGMFSMIFTIFGVGLIFSKKIKVNKVLLVTLILINIYILLISGSRTSYVGLLVFLVFFSFYKTSKFIFFGAIIVSLFSLIIMYNPDLYVKIDDVINNRVVSKIENEEDLENADVGKLYEDLGAGRSNLSLLYVKYIMSNPEIIPFGLGFNNRMTKGYPAHNMYLTVIKELGLVGFFLYFGWLIQYLFISFKSSESYSLALKGVVLAMLVTLFFGEHLYIYRPLFAIVGIFLIVVNVFISSLHHNENINLDKIREDFRLRKGPNFKNINS